mmetsp:Transcript_26269/g.4529  ORF Transcript_26269/g.4529 Transcript_26269/m.4529 type:complete len:169 (+) Transcript_26269:388-894(+)
MKNSFDRIIKNENRVVSALRSVMINLNKLQNEAFYKWKDQIVKNKLTDAERKVKGQQIHNALTKPTRRHIRSSHDRFKLPVKLMNTITKLNNFFTRRPREAFDIWKNCLNPSVDDSKYKAERLRNCLSSVPRRVLRDAYDRTLNNGDNVKAAIRRIAIGIQNMPRDAF